MRTIRAIIFKEFAEILRNRALVVSSLIPSIVFVVMPLMVGLRGGRMTGTRSQITVGQMGDILSGNAADLRDLSPVAIGQVFIFRQFALMMLFVPIITSLAIAAHSIIGEKQTRSLEPLLATPVSSIQLLIAKCLSSALPSVGLTWVAFTAYATAIHVFALPGVLTHVLNITTLLLILVICPLVAVLGLSLGVIVSSRANDPRTAQQIGGIFVLPIMGLFIAQISGLYFLTIPVVLGGIVGLAIIDAIVLSIGVALFDRETILLRWK
jgi:ABC-2 type transport system permease protein